jgi:hypothetical protein
MRFTIRDLLLLMLVGALAIGWVVDRKHLADENEKLRKASDQANAWVVPIEKAMKDGSIRNQMKAIREYSDRKWRGESMPNPSEPAQSPPSE